MKLSFINLKVASFFSLLSLLIASCGLQVPILKQTTTERDRILATIPEHSGTSTTGKYGLYSYEVYPHSVSIRAISPIVYVTQVEVFDLSKDGVFDSVWVCERGVWKFASTLNSRFRLSLPNTADESVLRDYIGLASYAKNKVKQDKAAAEKQRAESSIYRSTEKLSSAMEERSKMNWFEYQP